jgi:carboxymethylenebutenolidase
MIMKITSTDDREFAAELVLPPSGRGPGIILFQEIFGVNDFLLGKAKDLADLGYLVCCPDVFWRIEPGVSLPHDEIGLQRGMTIAGRWMQEVPDEMKLADMLAVLKALRDEPSVSGPVGVVGYCFGGTAAYLLAAHGDPAACVSYYGSGIANQLELLPSITCPVLFHFGGNDPYIPREHVEQIKTACEGRSNAQVRIEPEAGHAFENLLAPAFSDPEAASRSWPATVEFLRQHLPVGR